MYGSSSEEQALASARPDDEFSFAPVVQRRPADPHMGNSIVSMCTPKLSPNPEVLISCSRQQQNIVVWSSSSDYVTYRAHAGGARYGQCLLVTFS